jgi:hypothetical protein
MTTDLYNSTINRSVIFVIPKQAAFDWIVAVDPEPLSLTLEDVRSEVDGFLVSQEEIETTEDAQRLVYRQWKNFFEHFLFEWYTDEKLWPQKRSLKMFKEWFDIRFHPMLWDLSDEPIRHEEWTSDEDSA